MATDYEKVYRERRHALGGPSREFVRFFESYDRNDACVLDVGCGQGRGAGTCSSSAKTNQDTEPAQLCTVTIPE